MPRAASRPLAPNYAAPGPKEIWLTFDDGPHPAHTKKILAVLAAHGVTATFFVTGKNCAFYPAMLKAVAAGGHRIGNHTFNHPKLTALTAAKVKSEIARTEALIAPYLKGGKLFRPPYGAHNAMVDRVAARLGYRTVIWNVDTVDWSPNFKPSKWVTHGIAQIKARQTSVVLAHDIQKTTAAHLDSFIRKIKALPRAVIQPAASL